MIQGIVGPLSCRRDRGLRGRPILHDAAHGKAYRHRRADSGLALQVEGAAVQLDKGLGQWQAEAGAFGLALAGILHLTEAGQGLRDVVGCDANPGVRDLKNQAALLPKPRPENDLAANISEFDGIDQQVDQDLPQLALIGPQRRQVLAEIEIERDPAFRCALAHQSLSRTNQLRDLDPGLVKLLASGFDLGQVQYIIDEVELVLARVVNVGRVFAIFRPAERAEYFPLDHLGKADDGVERSAQLVTHHGEELRLGLIRLS